MMDFFSSFLLFVLCCLLHHLTNYKKKTQKKTWMLITVKFGFNTIHKTSSVIAIQITTSPECQLFCSLFMPISSQIINHQSGESIQGTEKALIPTFCFQSFYCSTTLPYRCSLSDTTLDTMVLHSSLLVAISAHLFMFIPAYRETFPSHPHLFLPRPRLPFTMPSVIIRCRLSCLLTCP